LATKRDGYVELANRAVSSRAVTNQIGVEPHSITVWGDTLLVHGATGEPMAYRDGNWQLAHPLVDPPPAEPEMKSERGHPLRWGNVLWDTAPGDALWIVAKEAEVLPGGGRISPEPPRRLLVGQRRSDGFVVMGDEVTSLSPDRVYGYPHGKLIATDQHLGSWVFEDHRWLPIDAGDTTLRMREHVAPFGSGHIAQVTSQGERGLAFYEPSRTPPLSLVRSMPSAVSDAISWDARHLLVAARPHVCIFDIGNATCSPLRRAPPAGSIEWLARDGGGRIWLGGRGLFVIDEQARVVRFDRSSPFLEGATVFGLKAHRHRLVVAMGDRGLAVVDTDGLSAAPCSTP
jgi:hypothetical protein